MQRSIRKPPSPLPSTIPILLGSVDQVMEVSDPKSDIIAEVLRLRFGWRKERLGCGLPPRR